MAESTQGDNNDTESRDVINDLVSAIEAVPGALTVQSASTETGWGVPTEATICLAGQNHAVQAVVDAFREVARRDYQRVLTAAHPKPLLEHHPDNPNPDRTRIMRDGKWVKP